MIIIIVLLLIGEMVYLFVYIVNSRRLVDIVSHYPFSKTIAIKIETFVSFQTFIYIGYLPKSQCRHFCLQWSTFLISVLALNFPLCNFHINTTIPDCHAGFSIFMILILYIIIYLFAGKKAAAGAR